MKTFIERFNGKTKSTENGCVLWTGSKDKNGYGFIQKDGKRSRTHRAIWEYYNGTIPAGMCVCHHCDTPSCVNINHLFLGTQNDNMQDMQKKGRKVVNSNPIRGENHWTKKHPENMARLSGEKNGSSKLTSEQVKNILAENKNEKHSETYYAKKYSVGRSTIGRILRNESWKE
jgi:hypothetical protein